MASPTQGTWVWISSGGWWWTGSPGELQSMGSQRVRHDWAAELNVSCSAVFYSEALWTIAHQLLCPWDSPGKNFGVGCHALLQGIFPTQGSHPCLLHWQEGSLSSDSLGKPTRVLATLHIQFSQAHLILLNLSSTCISMNCPWNYKNMDT